MLPKTHSLILTIDSHSATITSDYLPHNTRTKLIDFCFFINPEEQYNERIRAMRRELPMESINHTSYLGLAGQPITVSLETKRTGRDMDNAALQIGVWHSAQWRALWHLLEKAGGKEHAKAALKELGLLPAIITQGHEWSFAATTREGTKTVSPVYIPGSPPTNSQAGFVAETAFWEH